MSGNGSGAGPRGRARAAAGRARRRGPAQRGGRRVAGVGGWPAPGAAPVSDGGGTAGGELDHLWGAWLGDLDAGLPETPMTSRSAGLRIALAAIRRWVRAGSVTVVEAGRPGRVVTAASVFANCNGGRGTGVAPTAAINDRTRRRTK